MCAISASAMRQVRNLFVFDTLSSPGRASARPPAPRQGGARQQRAFGKFVGRRDELRVVGGCSPPPRAVPRACSPFTRRSRHRQVAPPVRGRAAPEGQLQRRWYSPRACRAAMTSPLSGIQGMPPDALRHRGGRRRVSHSPDRPAPPRSVWQDDVDRRVPQRAPAPSVAPTRRPRRSAATRRASSRTPSRASYRPSARTGPRARVGLPGLDGRGQLGTLLETVLARTPQSRVLVVFAARAGFSHLLESSRRTRLPTSPISPDEVDRLVAVRLGVTRVPPELLRFIKGARRRASADDRGEGGPRRGARSRSRTARSSREARRPGPLAAEDAARPRRLAHRPPRHP